MILKYVIIKADCKFYDRKEIKDSLAYLRVIANQEMRILLVKAQNY